MSKTIKQQAEYLWPDNDELSCKQANAYMMGANAVLSEIEKMFDQEDYMFGFELVEAIKIKINELKGKEE